MICALTVRTLQPGTFEDFRAAFLGSEDLDNMPAGWTRFNMLRNAENPDEVITFGFFDGDVEALRASAADTGYEGLLEAIGPYVKGVVADGLYEIVEDRTPQSHPHAAAPTAG